MKTKPPLTQQLAALDAKTILQLLAEMQVRWAREDARRARETILQRLLQTRLAKLTATEAPSDTLLTIAEVAKALKVAKARVYDLTRIKVLPSVRIGERQVRVRKSDLAAYLQPR